MLRRLLSVLLLVLIGFSLVSPVVTASEKPELPACCRKGGAHHCDMDAKRQGPGFYGRCSSFPGGAVEVTQTFHATPVSLSAESFGFFAHPRVLAQTLALARVSLTRGWYKRGPPSFFL